MLENPFVSFLCLVGLEKGVDDQISAVRVIVENWAELEITRHS